MATAAASDFNASDGLAMLIGAHLAVDTSTKFAG